MAEIVTQSPDQTLAEGRKLGATLNRGDVVSISGELGVGKTVFCKGVADGLGVAVETVSSPSFAIVNEYEGSETAVLHVDFFRLSGGDEAERIGWDEYLERDAVILVEWPEIAPDVLPEQRVEVSIKFLTSGKDDSSSISGRVIHITSKTDKSART